MFDKYDYPDVYNRIHQLRIESNKCLEQFANQFLHLCYEFPDEYVDWESLDEKFWILVRISRNYFQSDSSQRPFQDVPQYSEKESTTIFIPYPPPFDVPRVVPIQIRNIKMKSTNLI